MSSCNQPYFHFTLKHGSHPLALPSALLVRMCGAELDAGVLATSLIFRVGQNRIYTPYMTVYMVNSLPKIPYTHCIYMVLANPTYFHFTLKHGSHPLALPSALLVRMCGAEFDA